jgi:site-specific recombinase XerD
MNRPLKPSLKTCYFNFIVCQPLNVKTRYFYTGTFILLGQVLLGLIRKFIYNRLNNDNVKPATINRDLVLLKIYLFQAVDDELINKNPMKKIKMLAENNKRDRVMSFEEQKKIYNYNLT